TRERTITEFQRLFDGVDGDSEGCWPVTTSGRDPGFDPHRVRDAWADADAGGDLDGFVEQGERALRFLEREPGREHWKAVDERGVDAGGTGDAHRFVSGRDRGVERRFGDLERAAEREESAREFEQVSGLARQVNPFLGKTSCLLE